MLLQVVHAFEWLLQFPFGKLFLYAVKKDIAVYLLPMCRKCRSLKPLYNKPQNSEFRNIVNKT